MKILFPLSNLDFFRPLGVMQLSAIAREEGHETDLVVLSQEDIFEKIRKFRPDILAYSCTTGEYTTYSRINKEIKSRNPEIFTIMGGPHTTFFPESLKDAHLDAICIGEGDEAFRELIDGKNPKDIENIAIRNGKKIKLKPLIQELDELPFPDRKLFYRDVIQGKRKLPVMSFMTSRGCPFSCTYCFNHSYKEKYPKQNYLRRHSVNYVLEEIKQARKLLGFRFVKFIDDVFALKQDRWMDEFCKRYPQEVGLPFYAHSRFDLITPEIARKLSKAGCTTIEMSIESANQSIRKEILGRNMTDEEIVRGARYCKENGISVVTCLMTGLPNASLKDELNAIDLCIKAKIDAPEFFVYQPYPRTKLGDSCISKGLFDGDISRIQGYSFSKPSVLDCFSEKEKNAHINLSLLGPISVRYPFLKNLMLRHFLYCNDKDFLRKVYTLEKTFAYPSRVYKIDYSWKERLQIMKDAFNLEKIKRK